MNKKRIACFAVAAAMCVPSLASGCATGGGGYTVTYYDSDGTTVLLEQTVKSNGKAYDWTPSKDGLVFEDWYTTADLTVPYNFSESINSDVKIYAKFGTSSVTDSYKVSFVESDGVTKLMEQSVDKNDNA